MARIAKTERTVQKNIALPIDLAARMEVELFSEVEGRIPLGAHGKLIEGLLRQHFKVLDRARKVESNREIKQSLALPEGTEAASEGA